MKKNKINSVEETLAKYKIKSLDHAKEICQSKGIDVEKIVKGIQPIAFENAVLAYTLGVAIAILKNEKTI